MCSYSCIFTYAYTCRLVAILLRAGIQIHSMLAIYLLMNERKTFYKIENQCNECLWITNVELFPSSVIIYVDKNIESFFVSAETHHDFLMKI